MDVNAAREIFQEAIKLIERGKVEEGFLLCLTNEYSYYLLEHDNSFLKKVEVSFWSKVKSRLAEYANFDFKDSKSFKENSKAKSDIKEIEEVEGVKENETLIILEELESEDFKINRRLEFTPSSSKEIERCKVSKFILFKESQEKSELNQGEFKLAEIGFKLAEIESKFINGLYKLAASNDSLLAYHELGEEYIRKSKLTKIEDYLKAMKYYTIAAKKNFPPSQFCLAKYYARIKKFELAIHWQKKALANGQRDSCCELAKYYLLQSQSCSSCSSYDNLKLARRVYEKGYDELGCTSCCNLFVESFDRLNEGDKTRNEAEKICEYIHRIGFSLVVKNSASEFYHHFGSVRKFYEKYEHLVNFSNEYERLCHTSAVLIGKNNDVRNSDGKNNDNKNNDDDKATSNKMWINLILMLLIQRKDCPFHQINAERQEKKLKCFAMEIMEICLLPFDVSMICSHYLFDFPRWIKAL